MSSVRYNNRASEAAVPKYGTRYKLVNLDNSDLSSNLSVTRKSNQKKMKLNRSWNRIPDLGELNRGRQAKQFR